MSEDWKVGFKRAFLDVIIDDGAEFQAGSDYYTGGTIIGRAPLYAWQIREIGIDYAASSWTETEWYEFMGTSFDGDCRRFTLDAKIALLDGTTKDWRYSETLSTAILAVLAKAAE